MKKGLLIIDPKKNCVVMNEKDNVDELMQYINLPTVTRHKTKKDFMDTISFYLKNETIRTSITWHSGLLIIDPEKNCVVLSKKEDIHELMKYIKLSEVKKHKTKRDFLDTINYYLKNGTIKEVIDE